MNMADRIQYLRKAKGISQEELAEKVGDKKARQMAADAKPSVVVS